MLDNATKEQIRELARQSYSGLTENQKQELENLLKGVQSEKQFLIDKYDNPASKSANAAEFDELDKWIHMLFEASRRTPQETNPTVIGQGGAPLFGSNFTYGGLGGSGGGAGSGGNGVPGGGGYSGGGGTSGGGGGGTTSTGAVEFMQGLLNQAYGTHSLGGPPIGPGAGGLVVRDGSGNVVFQTGNLPQGGSSGGGGGGGVGGTPGIADVAMPPEYQALLNQYLGVGGGSAGGGTPQPTFDDLLNQYNIPTSGGVVGGGVGGDMSLDALLQLLAGLGGGSGGNGGGGGSDPIPGTDTPPVTDSGETPYQLLLDQFQQAWEAANAANEQRYNSINAGYDALVAQEAANRQSALNFDSEKLDLQERYNRMRGSAEQDLINRGLGNTTVRPSVMRGIEQDRGREQIRLNESIARLNQEILNDPNSAARQQLLFQERRNDVAPDMSQLLGLFSNLGQGGVVADQAVAASAVNTALGGQGLTPEQLHRLELQRIQGTPSGASTGYSNSYYQQQIPGVGSSLQQYPQYF